MAALLKKYPPKPKVEVADISEEQLGIGSILAGEKMSTRPSLRRTFSADMSSKKWMAEYGFARVPSSKELCVISPDDSSSCSSSSDEESDIGRVEHKMKDLFEIPDQDDVWRAIQGKAKKEKDAGYLSPSLKMPSSSLSQSSLDMCTEALGSDNGSSGCFSDFEELLAVSQTPANDAERKSVVIKKKMLPRVHSFPPPLTSATQIRSHRCNGRLVLQAVPVQPRSCFRAERQDGRLLLILINPHSNRVELEENDEEEEEEEEEKVEEDVELSGSAADLVEAEPCIVGAAVMEQQMTELTLKRMLLSKLNLHGILPFKNNQKPIWAAGNSNAGKGLKPPLSTPTPPIPLLPPPAQAMNAYDYGWKASIYSPTYVPSNKITFSSSTTRGYNEFHGAKTKPFLLQTNDFIMVGCKESRTSLLIWEPRCITTS